MNSRSVEQVVGLFGKGGEEGGPVGIYQWTDGHKEDKNGEEHLENGKTPLPFPRPLLADLPHLARPFHCTVTSPVTPLTVMVFCLAA